MKKIKLLAWKACVGFLKFIAKCSIWVLRRKRDDFDMWELGSIFESIYLNWNGPIGTLSMVEWFYDTGWDLKGEAARNQFENIKALNGDEEEKDLDWYPYDIIENYFEN